MLTRREELEMLEAFRSLTREEDWKALAKKEPSADEPVGLKDQQRAAVEETRRLTPHIFRTGVVRPGEHTAEQKQNRMLANSPASLALLMAGLKRCNAGHACPHVETGDRPLIYYFAARVASCRECMPRFQGPIAAQHRRVAAKADTECDLCLTVGHEDFMTIGGQLGPAYIHADICEECERIVFEEDDERRSQEDPL
jgi:hypothetical protein